MLGKLILVASILGFGACSGPAENNEVKPATTTATQITQPTHTDTPAIPNLQAEILDDGNKTTNSPIGSVDFKNYTYQLPRGWENQDGKEITLTNGRVDPVSVSVQVNEKMTDEEKAEVKARRRIGLSFVTTRYLDLTNDGEDEAVVILKIETGGNAIPQVVYVFTWKNGKPELIWTFRTGDRADGGLKDIRAENGEVVVELFGQDRFILGQVETGKVTGDEEQLCCPTFFTRSRYKWNGASFLLTGKRLTYSINDPSAPPLENWGDKVNAKNAAKK
jgi:hypothetical protein